jgi:hypothetical protein
MLVTSGPQLQGLRDCGVFGIAALVGAGVGNAGELCLAHRAASECSAWFSMVLQGKG